MRHLFFIFPPYFHFQLKLCELTITKWKPVMFQWGLTGQSVSWSGRGPGQWRWWAESRQADPLPVWLTWDWGWILGSRWCPGFVQKQLLWTDGADACLGPLGPRSLPPLSTWRYGPAHNLWAIPKKGGKQWQLYGIVSVSLSVWLLYVPSYIWVFTMDTLW